MGKSTLLASAAAHVWKTSKKKTRVVGADGGGTTTALKILMDEGIVDYWPIDSWDEKSIFYTLDMATKGWWPEDVSTPNSTLVPPSREYKACPSCGGDSGAKGLTMVPKCISCSHPFAAGTTLRITREPLGPFANVGLVGFEGLTSFGDLLLRRLRKIDPTGGRSIQDGDFKISSLGMQHYGDAQNYIAQYVSNVRLIPVETIIWTALEVRSDDDGKPLYGPALPGKKLTSLCIPWFTDVLHLDAIAKRDARGLPTKDANGMEVLDRKLYLAPHFPSDSPGARFAAKTSAPHGGDMPLVLDCDMEVFFAELTKAFDKAKKRMLG
jgi:hypothetical protein